MKATKKGIGRRVRFSAAAMWSGAIETRTIVGVGPDGSVLVRFGGWSDFHVNTHEIIEIFVEGG